MGFVIPSSSTNPVQFFIPSYKFSTVFHSLLTPHQFVFISFLFILSWSFTIHPFTAHSAQSKGEVEERLCCYVTGRDPCCIVRDKKGHALHVVS
jgi:hypothetical protein